MHLEFWVKPINDKKDAYWTAPILNQETVPESQFYAEYIYNAFALNFCLGKIAIFEHSIYNR